MTELTPRQVVDELDRYIIGQDDAKRAVAIAIRNRWRRQQLGDELRQEVTPKNIIMIGPTGVGKTEIARRLAQLIKAPFIKIEATKYTEVGYHGRDVEAIIRELLDIAINMVKQEERIRVEEKARELSSERLLNLLVPDQSDEEDYSEDLSSKEQAERRDRTRAKMRKLLDAGKLEESLVELTTESKPPVQVFSNMGLEQMDFDFQHMFEKIIPKQTQHRKIAVKDARKIIVDQEIESLIDPEKINAEAIERCQDGGIVFLDEIDKVCGPDSSHGPDVSRQGVQRDLLPIVEGTTVQTKHGSVKTDHVLFIAAGAFHKSKPSDLMPELQGRFPIRVELADLTRDDFLRILQEPQNSLIRQYQGLLATEKIELNFTEDSLQELAQYAFQVNKSTQNIGARRLHTILERLVEDISFDAPEMRKKKIKIDAKYVNSKLEAIAKDEDLSRFIL